MFQNTHYDCAEARKNSSTVLPSSYIGATGGITREFYNPAHAVFSLEHPERLFPEDRSLRTPTHWPGGWLTRVG